MLPEQVDPATQSNAEKKLFRLLASTGSDDWTHALHSLNLSEHQWKRVGEIDFLLIGPAGILALEVKGGRVGLEGSRWTFRDRFGNVRRRRSGPFEQSRTAMFALQRRLESLVERKLVDRTAFGYGVVFPDMIFDLRSVEWADEMVLDRRHVARPEDLAGALGRLATYWRSKPGERRRVLNNGDTARFLAALRPDYDIVPTLGRVSAAAEVELASLTELQYRSLDAHARNPRIIYEGGAGTGKTMLAAELGRRLARQDGRVLFTCHSPVLAAHVGAQPGMDAVTVAPVDRLPSLRDQKFDALVVDEAQDLVNSDNLGVLEGLLEGGLNEGRWMFFLDANTQRGLVGAFEPEAMDYLRLSRPAEFSLLDNCRNTATVVDSVIRMTGADVGVSTAGTGPAVSARFVSDRTAAAEFVRSELDRLAEQDVPASQIMLLSTVDLGESVFAALPARWRQRIEGLDLDSWYTRPATSLGFARVQDFKGLESPFIILTDVSLSGGDAARAALYVGMTRARIGLSLTLPVADQTVLRNLEESRRAR
jgi:hypothetical protein